METSLTLPVTLEEKTFRAFADFDAHTLNKRWLPSVVGGVIMLVCALISFFILPNASLIGGALLCLGLGIPFSYFQRRAISLKKQIQDNKLEKAREIYTVLLSEKGVAQKIGDNLSPVVAWDKVFGAWKTTDAIYLYVLPNRALLLPEGGIPESQDTVWAFLSAHMSEEKLH